MFGIGTFEFLVIMLVAILVLGPEHLPRVMRTVTKVMSDFRRMNTDFQRAINLEANKEEYRQKHGDDAFAPAASTTKKKKKAKKKVDPAEDVASSPDTEQQKQPEAAPAEPSDIVAENTSQPSPEDPATVPSDSTPPDVHNEGTHTPSQPKEQIAPQAPSLPTQGGRA